LSEEIIAVADLGGTNARFALARLEGGRVQGLDAIRTLPAGDYPGLEEAWRDYSAGLPQRPKRAAFALACPVRGDEMKFVNNHWRFRKSEIAARLGLDQALLVNDFGAIAHAAALLEPAHLVHIAGPRRLVDHGVTTIIGPGTGLGVAILIQDKAGRRVIETEGAHVSFAPLDSFEAKHAARLSQKYGRVSVERVVSGPGLAELVETLTGAPAAQDAPALWADAMSGADAAARQALVHFCNCLGAAIGDAALAHGAQAVMIAGGLTPRLAHLLPHTNFAQRLVAKGRYHDFVADLPVWLITHPQPGLFGAAAAFLAQKE
jgi:glucokinase